MFNNEEFLKWPFAALTQAQIARVNLAATSLAPVTATSQAHWWWRALWHATETNGCLLQCGGLDGLRSDHLDRLIATLMNLRDDAANGPHPTNDPAGDITAAEAAIAEAERAVLPVLADPVLAAWWNDRLIEAVALRDWLAGK